jgi:hypothetical protein
MTNTETTWERDTAADLEPGDRFAEARTHPPAKLVAVESIGPSSRWLHVLRDGALTDDRIRPRHTKRFWREVRP